MGWSNKMKQMYDGKALIKKRERGISCTGEPGRDKGYIHHRGAEK